MIKKVYVRAERFHPFSNFEGIYYQPENFKRMKNSIIFLILAFLIIEIPACKSQKKLTKTSEAKADNSLTSLDWAGTYQGILPCADCPGIKTQLVLNSDMTYQAENQLPGKRNWN